MMESSDSAFLLVAAIDFGTAYSGYAFSFKDEYASQPNNVHTNKWTSGSQGSAVAISQKAPTAVLFKPDKSFHSFGYDAENKYAELCLDKEDNSWYYFKHFKMQLYNHKGLQRRIMLRASNGFEMPAIKVFSECIHYLREQLIVQISRSRLGVEESDIKWVVTVPAIWDDKAKQFMREAAELAGISRHSLSLALEPEAASVYCKHVVEAWYDGDQRNVVKAFDRGSRYLVLDAGGGTIDITVHEVQANSRLMEIHNPTGGPWGGTTVDRAFLNLIQELVGKDVMDEFFKQHSDDCLDLVRDLEGIKMKVSKAEDPTIKYRLRIPMSLKEVYSKLKNKSIEDAVLPGRISAVSRDRIVIDNTIIDELYRDSINETVDTLVEIFRDPTCQNVTYIVMVGAFSESVIFKNAIKRYFPDKRVVYPLEPGLAVLKGAVMYGHDPKVIAQRIARRSYGICSFVEFVEGEDPPENRAVIDGVVKCKNFFKKHVTKSQELNVGQVQHEEVYNPVDDRQTEMQFDIYTSPEANPKYIDHAGCTYLGKLIVPIAGTGKNRAATVGMMFGETEMKVVVRDRFTNKETTGNFDFLE